MWFGHEVQALPRKESPLIARWISRDEMEHVGARSPTADMLRDKSTVYPHLWGPEQRIRALRYFDCQPARIVSVGIDVKRTKSPIYRTQRRLGRCRPCQLRERQLPSADGERPQPARGELVHIVPMIRRIVAVRRPHLATVGCVGGSFHLHRVARLLAIRWRYANYG